MDLQSYIKLKETYKGMHQSPVEEEVLDESRAEARETSRRAREARRQQAQDSRDAQFRAGGGDAKVRELTAKGYLPGQARQATMVQGSDNQRRARQQSSSNTSSSSSSGSGARDPESGLPMNKGGSTATSSPSSSSARDPESGLPADRRGSNRSTFPNTSGNQSGSSSRSTQQPAQRSSQQSSQSSSQQSSQRSTQQPAQRSTQQPAQRSSQQSSQRSSQPTRPATPPRDRMAGASKEARSAAWAKANPTLAKAQTQRSATRGTAQSSNPMMRGLTRTSPKASSPASSPSSSSPASSSSGIKSNRLSKALSSVKKFGEDTEMDVFDIILNHLVESGFPQEEALQIMITMDEEKKQAILAERGGNPFQVRFDKDGKEIPRKEGPDYSKTPREKKKTSDEEENRKLNRAMGYSDGKTKGRRYTGD